MLHRRPARTVHAGGNFRWENTANWFNMPGYIGKVTTTGVVTEFPIPTTTTGFLTWGPDGNLWVTDPNSNQIFKVSIGPL